MEEFVHNFVSGDPFTLIAVGLVIFSVVVVFLMRFYNFRLEVNSKNASIMVILLLITIGLPLTLQSVSMQQNIGSEASEAIKVSEITINPIASRTYEIYFKTNIPVIAYLSYDERKPSSVMLPEIAPAKKTDHAFLVRNLPDPIKKMTIVANNSPTRYAITIPQLLQ